MASIDQPRSHRLSLIRQRKLLELSRSSLHYTPVGLNAEIMKLISKIDRVFKRYPFFGSSAGAGLQRTCCGVVGLFRQNKVTSLAAIVAVIAGLCTTFAGPSSAVRGI